MATLTIEIPDSLHEHMSQVDADWSEICRQAITTKLASTTQNTKKPEPAWLDTHVHLSPETVIKPIASVSDGILHPHQFTKKFDDILRTNKFTLSNQELHAGSYVNSTQKAQILEPYAEWRPCFYILRTTLNFVYLDSHNYCLGSWKWSKGHRYDKSSNPYVKILFGINPDLAPVSLIFAQPDDKSVQFVIPKFLKTGLEFTIETPEMEEKVICQGLYDSFTLDEISGSYIDDQGNQKPWYATRL